jgi:ATPase subunit of ABC transporter with duplicated ATPase domains
MSITLNSLGYHTPTGHSLFTHLQFTFHGGHRYGLVGMNGVGKSTLAHLMVGSLNPTEGGVLRRLTTGYLSQAESVPAVAVREFLGDYWPEIRAEERPLVQMLGAGIDSARACSALSGGEWMRVRLIQLLAQSADFLILDEPTNNLDELSRRQVTAFVETTRRGLLVISHDRKLLGSVGTILELSNLGLATFGGNWTFYEAENNHQTHLAAANLHRAKKERASAQLERQMKAEQMERRGSHAESRAERVFLSRAEKTGMKRRAQMTSGKLDVQTAAELQEREDEAKRAWAKIKQKPRIYFDVPEAAVLASQPIFVAERLNFRYPGAESPVWRTSVDFAAAGPVRIHLRGANGSGKSTFIRLLADDWLSGGTVIGSIRRGKGVVRCLDQSLKLLSMNLSVRENVVQTSNRDEKSLRNLLAQFLFAGVKIHQKASTLSGGEKVRLALAKILLADSPPELLILDEPTNNLDIENLEFLEMALASYRGALLVVSHDESFVDHLGITDVLDLDWHLGS